MPSLIDLQAKPNSVRGKYRPNSSFLKAVNCMLVCMQLHTWHIRPVLAEKSLKRLNLIYFVFCFQPNGTPALTATVLSVTLIAERGRNYGPGGKLSRIKRQFDMISSHSQFSGFLNDHDAQELFLPSHFIVPQWRVPMTKLSIKMPHISRECLPSMFKMYHLSNGCSSYPDPRQ
ncbi:conserved hypothetical protein [Coccidioides posadasii str. Silveira]|uniref:Uncharacterized protein n=2 Tax=Coccidioides posadasii TaxID=199306 RepID=E9D020_COCPS|nr:conserved hypothetical protein [Coccidioides posadasii str. Silveira]KMM73162.1 hypothetical protein CPAG_09451 [Coccidioides posadasii RMSCC 3488]